MSADAFGARHDASGLTFRQAADPPGVAVSTIDRWRGGHTPIGVTKAELIRERLKAEPAPACGRL